MSFKVIGLDIGGANLKAADGNGLAVSSPFALWKHPERLAQALKDLLSPFLPASHLAVTMTGELCDCYLSKRHGACSILDSVEEAFTDLEIEVWSTEGRFLSTDEARRQPIRIAAANWHALATWAGKSYPVGTSLLFDLGSTTTDLILVQDGSPCPTGWTDRERLQSRELVYTGFRRTPVCAILGFEGAAEFFATTEDVYLILKMIAEDESNCETADGRSATIEKAHRRMARMIGADLERSKQSERNALAEQVRARQIQALLEALAERLQSLCEMPTRALLAGSGEPLARLVIQASPQLSKSTVISLSPVPGSQLSNALCAYAVSRLLSERWD